MSNSRIVQTKPPTVSVVARKNNLSGDTLSSKLQAYKEQVTKGSASVSVMGAAWDIGAPIFGSSLGPARYNRTSRFAGVLQTMLGAPHFAAETDQVVEQSTVVPRMSRWCLKLAHQVSDTIKQQKKIAVIGGDHSCAIGTWHGVADALASDKSFGVIWIDAHLDSHTPDTSFSGKLHGMPLAVLLGYGDENLVNLLARPPVLRPENVAVIGARNVEKGELELLQDLGVRIYFMPEIKKRGLDTVLTEAQRIAVSGLEKGSEHFGISIDLDVIDPLQAPGVNSHEADGLNINSLLNALKPMHQCKGFLGVEVAEFNPLNDLNLRTVHVIDQLLDCLLPELSLYYKQDDKQEIDIYQNHSNARLLQGGCS